MTVMCTIALTILGCEKLFLLKLFSYLFVCVFIYLLFLVLHQVVLLLVPGSSFRIHSSFICIAIWDSGWSTVLSLQLQEVVMFFLSIIFPSSHIFLSNLLWFININPYLLDSRLIHLRFPGIFPRGLNRELNLSTNFKLIDFFIHFMLFQIVLNPKTLTFLI